LSLMTQSPSETCQPEPELEEEANSLTDGTFKSSAPEGVEDNGEPEEAIGAAK
jgi:hypothetical protein